MIIQKLRKSKCVRLIALFMTLNLALDLVVPHIAHALTGGPSQPEVQGFEPIGTSEMVDLFSGDFSYNIPLLDVGGYPINISYHSGIGMDQEASWVGLGWNINAGVINRSMRGLPDDFRGRGASRDEIRKEYNIRQNNTFGANFSLGEIEVLGKGKPVSLDLGLGFGLFHNNYKGIGYELTIDPNISIADKNKNSLNAGLGLSLNSQQGIGVEPSLGLSVNTSKIDANDDGSSALSAKVGAPYNSRTGLKNLTINVSKSVSEETGRVLNKEKEPFAERAGLTRSTGTSVPIGTQSYTPQIQMPMINTSVSLSAGLGPEIKWLNFTGRLRGYYHGQALREKVKVSPAYGYLYADVGQSDRNAMHDFNREKDGTFTNNTPGLPLTNFTYDIYSVQGQGVGGMYRPFRGDVGHVFDAANLSHSVGGNLGGDFGGGDVVKGGFNGGFNFNTSSSGNWSSGNAVEDELSFKDKEERYKSFEPFYFKQAGELTAAEVTFQNDMGDDKAMRLSISSAGTVGNSFIKKLDNKNNENAENIGYGIAKARREKRNQAINILTAGVAQHTAAEKEILSFEFTDKDKGISIANSYDRVDNNKKPHHISEITTYRPDGSRYVFGIPAYNLKQKEVTFNAGPDGNKQQYSPDCNNGLIQYDPGVDNSVDNMRGQDYYYSSTEMPAFAHSYLLSSVLSPDYVDITGNGITDDDLGNYTKLNYTRKYGETDPFEWRVPVQANQASFNEGLKSDKVDDKASYVYGQKEIWYMHSIETKTHIAEFYLTDRKDGFGVIDENGGADYGKPLFKLDSIRLYAKWDRQNNEEDAEPIKTVHFVYDYSQCKNVPNFKDRENYGNELGSENGKLTLKEIFFTYGNSKKGKLSPYRFHYGDSDHDGTPEAAFNPDYNLKGYDRWGNYKANPGDCDVTTGELTTSDNPYVDQSDRDQADINMAAWSLSTIDLPSGGRINVDYEADDYAHVQNKRAMQMFKVTGLSETADGVQSNLLFKKAGSGQDNEKYIQYRILHVDLPVPVSTKEEFREKYIGAETDLYFKFLVDIADDGSYDFVQGYAQIEDYNVDPSDNSKGWVKIKADRLRDRNKGNNDVNPISKTAWQFVRLHAPKKVYGSNEIDGKDESAIRRVLGFVSDIEILFSGYNRTLRNWGYGKKVLLNKSFIRLQNPDGKKIGGGVRVKKLTISDSWGDMVGTSNGSNFEYGQEYTYLTEDANGNETSSGVAVYEPLLGNEENPFRQPVAFTNEHKLAPDESFYQEEPYGETFFPNASVGYSKVEVKNLKRHEDDDPSKPLIVKRTATGKVIHEFYTAKDFPVITDKTRLDKKPDKPNWINKLLKVDVSDYMTVSQGYVVELNDMHGKQRRQTVYGEDQEEAISKVEYFYKTDTERDDRLNNEVTVINKDGTLTTTIVGQEMDMVNDFRENNTFSTGVNLSANLDVSLFPFPPPPIPIPSLWVGTSSEETRFRSVVTTKVIQRYGILEKIVATDLGSRVETENIAYDAETGNVLVTKTQNEYDDPVYSFTYPAHWGYDRMGMAYQNLGLEFAGSNITGEGNAVISNAKDFLVRGDEVFSTADNQTYWVSEVSNNSVALIDRNGSVAPELTGTTLIITRSGRRNQQNTPIGSVTSLENPINNNRIEFDEVLNASAVEFDESWKEFCECGFNPAIDIANPYVRGVLGNWRAKRSYLFLTDRSQSDKNNNTYVRKDGVFEAFKPFWKPRFGLDWTANKAPWQFTSEVTLFSQYGFELENKDALGRHSAAIYGYNNSLPVAVASNSEYAEIGFDNFEDYECSTCDDDHFSFKQDADMVTESKAHTGRKSIRVSGGNRITLEKVIVPCPTPQPPSGGVVGL